MIDDRAVANRAIASMTFKLKGGPRRKRAALTLGGRLVQCGPFACIAGQIEPVNQNGYAQKHEAPGHKATQAGLRGGVGGAREPDRPQDFSTRRDIPPVHTASPNLREAAVYWERAIARQEGPYTLRLSAKINYLLPPRHPRGFSKNPCPSTQSFPAPLKAPPFSSPFPKQSQFPAHLLLLC